jgi:hypothetical protein
MDDEPGHVHEEFVAEENVNTKRACQSMRANLSSPPQQESPSEAIQRGPFIFDPSLPPEEGEDTKLTAAMTKLNSCVGTTALAIYPSQD